MAAYDIAVIGAGIAGASLAAELAAQTGSGEGIVLLEAEDQPGYHTTGRSAAFWSETYGGPGIVPLSLASGDSLRDMGFLHRRGALHMVRGDDMGALDSFMTTYADTGAKLEKVGRQVMEAHVPGLRPEWQGAVYEPECSDIDVAGLHQHYLGEAARAGASLFCRARVVSCRRTAGACQITCADGRSFEAALLVNAAGAWADEIARLAGAAPLGITPYRRTVVQLALGRVPPPDLPLVLDIGGTFYFKPENGRLWLSPHDEVADRPGDVAAEEMAVAEAIDRFENVVDWPVDRVERRWAGLRSFAPDRLPVYGYDPDCEGFFWCAGQGGFGIQTAPAAARMAARLVTGAAPEEGQTEIDPAAYLPGRFHEVPRDAPDG
ncbi:NAD(P)/FAD-dependent oxidoreductase [Altererythrobacter sp. MTPC7]|uniref:NAD(P)/FAD-dependent oxidoreductase n=1 Tax=Altererythrobacter sp. MTPC7 TaxID=3056567 RepID=UPI0036F1C975